MEYNPDVWVVFKIEDKEVDSKPIYKVFGGWYGGFTQGDSWKINSGITKVEKDGDVYSFYGYSGSVYRVHINNYKMSGYMQSVWKNILNNFGEKAKMFEIMPEETDWTSLDYSG